MNKIHIGYPKTASTFLQKHIFPQLKSHQFLGHKEFVQSGLFDLLWKIERAVDYDKIQRTLKGKKYFISFEEITGPSLQGSIVMDEIPFRLKKALKKGVKVLITIRKQDDLIRSIYLQYIHLGGTLKLKNIVNNQIFGQSRIETHAYNFYETYKNYSKVFGSENIMVVPYEYLKEDKRLFKAKLEEFFENETFDFSINLNENKSVSGGQIHLLRFLNNFLSSWVSEKSLIPSFLINQNKLRLKLQQSNFLRVGHYFNREEDEFLINLLDNYNESNKQLDNELNLNLKKYGYYK